MDRLPDLIALVESVRAKHLVAPIAELAPVEVVEGATDAESGRRAA